MANDCDLILLTWNHLETTKRCLESLFRHTGLSCRLIIVDNGSDQPGAQEYLQSIRPKGNIQEAIYLRNEADLGFSKGMNRGLNFCLSNESAPYLCLISNDTIATNGWLSGLVQVAAENPVIGFVNPNSTNFGSYPPNHSVIARSTEGATKQSRFSSDKELSEYAIKMTHPQEGKWQELASCIGFCFLARREIFDKIGIFDESYGMAYYEDADLSKRAQAAGYLCALALGSYVYHEQGESFGKQQQQSPLFLKNEELFYSRWGMAKPGRIGYILGGRHIGIPRPLYEKIRESANQFNKIWVLTKGKKDNSDLPNHWNVQKISFRGPAFLFGFWSLIYLLVKKKKFKAVFVDDLRLLAFLKRFQRKYQGELRLLSMNNEQQTMNRPSYIICAVERGWKGMRQFALAMAEKGYYVDLILREKLPPQLRKIISPREGIQMIPCGKKIFPFRFAVKVMQRALRHKVTWLIFNRPERVKKNDWLRRIVAAESLVLEEKDNHYRLSLQGDEVTLDFLNNTK